MSKKSGSSVIESLVSQHVTDEDSNNEPSKQAFIQYTQEIPHQIKLASQDYISNPKYILILSYFRYIKGDSTLMAVSSGINRLVDNRNNNSLSYKLGLDSSFLSQKDSDLFFGNLKSNISNSQNKSSTKQASLILLEGHRIDNDPISFQDNVCKSKCLSDVYNSIVGRTANKLVAGLQTIVDKHTKKELLSPIKFFSTDLISFKSSDNELLLKKCRENVKIIASTMENRNDLEDLTKESEISTPDETSNLNSVKDEIYFSKVEQSIEEEVIPDIPPALKSIIISSTDITIPLVEYSGAILKEQGYHPLFVEPETSDDLLSLWKLVAHIRYCVILIPELARVRYISDPYQRLAHLNNCYSAFVEFNNRIPVPAPHELYIKIKN